MTEQEQREIQVLIDFIWQSAFAVQGETVENSALKDYEKTLINAGVDRLARRLQQAVKEAYEPTQ